MSWDHISKSLGTVVDERLSNPLVSSFAIAWVGWNYKFFFVLFAGDPVANKLFMLDALYSWNWQTLLKSVFGPAATAYAYLYVLPFASQPFFKKWRTNLKDFNGIKELVPIEDLITETQRIELMAEHAKVREESEQVRTEIRKLKADLNVANAKTDNYDALAQNNGKLTVKVDQLETAALEKATEVSRAIEALAATRRRARIFELYKLTLDAYMSANLANKNQEVSPLVIGTIQRAVNEFAGEEEPSINLPVINGVNFANLVSNINRKLDERDGVSLFANAS